MKFGRQKYFLWSSIFLALWFLASTRTGLAQIQFSGNNYTQYSVDQLNRDQYFENWTEVNLNYQRWRVGFRYEMHLPAQPFSQDTSGQGIYQKFLEYRGKNLTITAGNFYTMLGRGLVLRSYENRNLRWDTNIEGLKLDYSSRYVGLRLLGGRSRDRAGRRQNTFQAGEIRLKPLKGFQVGGSYLTNRIPSRGRVHWGSVFSEFQVGPNVFYAEYAGKDYPQSLPSGHAFYFSGNIFLQKLSLFAEIKNYLQFDLTEGVTYNNPPSVIREHLYTLLNRHQKVEEPNDEKGFLVEAVYPILPRGILTLNFNRTRSHNGVTLYKEYYGQFELDFGDRWEWVWGQGRQDDLEARYLNFLSSASFQLDGRNSLKLIFEQQQVRIFLTNRQYFNQAFQFSFARSPLFTVSLLGEYSTDQISDKNLWAGFQLDVQFLRDFDLTAFGGTRREGKICAGGVCVVRPEFEGVEFILSNRF